MTAILRQMQQLDARLEAGEISAEQHAKRRAMLINTVEIAEIDEVEPVYPDRSDDKISNDVRQDGAPSVAAGLFVSLVVLALCVLLAVVTPIEIDLALTIGVTALAVFTVRLLTKLED